MKKFIGILCLAVLTSSVTGRASALDSWAELQKPDHAPVSFGIEWQGGDDGSDSVWKSTLVDITEIPTERTSKIDDLRFKYSLTGLLVIKIVETLDDGFPRDLDDFYGGASTVRVEALEDFAPVPGPSKLLLLGTGLIVLASFRRKKLNS